MSILVEETIKVPIFKNIKAFGFSYFDEYVFQFNRIVNCMLSLSNETLESLIETVGAVS